MKAPVKPTRRPGKRRPAFLFYPGDWTKDPALRSCSIAARGLWFEMICCMEESKWRGYLQLKPGIPATHAQLATMTAVPVEKLEVLLVELEEAGVFSCTDEGVIYCRRIVRDAAEKEGNNRRQDRSRARKKGAAQEEPVTGLSQRSHTTSSSAAPISTSKDNSSSSGSPDALVDDDDLLVTALERMTTEMGVGHREAERALAEHPPQEILAVCDRVRDAAKNTTINNLPAYFLKALKNGMGTCGLNAELRKEAEEDRRQRKEAAAEAKAKAKQTMEKCHQEQQELQAALSDEEARRKYALTMDDAAPVLKASWDKLGWGSPLVRSAFSEWYAAREAQHKGSSCNRPPSPENDAQTQPKRLSPDQ